MLKKNLRKTSWHSIYLRTFLAGVFASAIFYPIFTFAATTYTQDLFGLFEYGKDIINDIVLWLLVTLPVAYFLFRLAKMIWEKPTPENKKYVLFGLIALTLMYTFYAVVGLFAVTFGIQIGIPQFFKAQDGLSPGSGYVNKSYSTVR